ncbi:protoplast regeneration and killer toxin resistance, variant [Gaeumannomyces tritici R3-111a-1]|uniref:Protoplast regeneration and killer toxin resistance n=1 Tax=Gaeumannomyces tritici (strain R3-111a-1) TaxID=644352 RepID=J3PFA8_GAET3|nr:protoplast regeneration and killer toxin resistance [Gaeumannomyces tritici R3-111a-1]XP_009228345.1 protoplast regeneration and killer toxin resistance, variant [Gaeumannomyces tritici R3-111a-1]EJT70010.1 protoplast regeneration and killer toxin resistance, variant [Gaeumannomyces tritici R3-111a-1]EJT70011.1 protoplast regeneration and killer toxin resistance [Gaeumannomyces tritici R3-111a-1]
MAAVTRSPPPSASSTSSPTRRKPLPLHDLPQIPQQRFDWDDAAVKPLPTVPLSVDSPRLRHPPRSPVLVNIKPDNWAQSSNASIEHHGDDALPPLPRRLDRDLPKTPDAPTPPPHTPALEKQQKHQQAQQHQHQDAHNLQHQRIMADQQSLRSVPGSEPQATPVTTSSVTAANSDALVSPSDSVSSSSRFAQADGRPPSSKMQKGKALEDRGDLSPRDENRDSRETVSTASTTQTQQQHSTTSSSAVTTASSTSGAVVDTPDTQDLSADPSPEGSVIEPPVRPESVPQLQYHHQQFLPRPPTIPAAAQEPDHRGASTPDLLENAGSSINRHLTPNQFMRRSSMPRPQSAYSAYSDRGRSPMTGNGQMRAPSAQSRRSPEVRNSSYSDMLNVPYPQPAPAPIPLDNSQLRTAVGTNASLLSTQKTLEMYRQNVKKTNDLSIQYSFAVFLISTAQELGFDPAEDPASTPAGKRKGSPKVRQDSSAGAGAGAGAASYLDLPVATPHELVREAKNILQKLASSGYPFAQYYLADGYASGLFSKGKEDYNAAFPLFVLAAKHGHAESGYRTGLCYEFGWGCRKDPAKAVQFLRTAASKRHPGAMNRLGKACLSGDLGERRYREGIKWLKLATEAADAIYNAAPYHLGCLYETGYGDDIFLDESYAAELFTQAADLGHPEASFRMGDAYEHGRLNCPRDPALSVHFYTGAAERGHAGAMMGLCAWYMVGAEPILDKDEEEAYEWAHRAADLGNVKAQYAVGYFTEMGIGCRRDILEANVWYVKAADAGDERAKQRLAAIRAAVSGGTPMEVAPPRNGKIKKASGEKDETCVVM